MLTVVVLGPVELRRDGARLAVPAGKTTEVLVRLALDAGVQVRTERLIEDLWSEQARAVVRNTLQSKVSQLRRALGDPGLVTAGGSGYTLAVDPGCVDALEVLRLADSATSSRKAGDPEATARACAAALAMFRGEVLPDAGSGAWLAPHRARLEEARLRLTEDWLAARIDLGAAGELVAELEGLVAVHPLREGLWQLLITALYRADRQADALAAYRRVRQRLADELGLDPGPELRALEQRVLQHDQELNTQTRIAPATSTGPPVSTGPARGNLPGVSASLVGRGADLAAVTGLVGDERLVTVVGPAGVGKTRLAIEVATTGAPAGGAWLVRLEATRAGEPLWPSVGEAFTMSAASEPMVLDRLRGVDLLLVLDNCEHLVADVADVVGRMLSAAPGLRVLATSQVPLGVDGEVLYPLAPLTIADSVALFTDRAARQRRSLRPDDDTGRLIEDVCRSLDGLPLAIELAAARTKALSVQEIARRLGDRFTLLNNPTSLRPARQRTLRAAIAWSYDLLFPDDQRGLWALACFSGGAPLTAAEDVLAALGVPSASAVDVVDRLVDRSLVSVDVAGGGVRYRLLDSVREFSLDRLREAGMADIALGAHAAWFAVAAGRAADGARGPDQAEHLAVAAAERANIDAALTWAGDHDPALGLRIANGFGWSWVVLGAGPVAAQRVRAALIAADAVAGARDRSTALLLAGFLEASGGNLERATADIEQAMAIDDDEMRSLGRLYLSFVHSQQGRAQEALVLLAGCRADFRRLGRRWEEGVSWLLSAWAAIALGDTVRGKAACTEALRQLIPLGDQWALNHTEAMLGELAQAEHRFTDATAHLRRAADATHQLGFAAAEAHHLTNLGRAQQQHGDDQAAVATLERAIEAGQATGDLRTAALAGVRLGRVLRGLGQRQPARAAIEPAQRWYLAAGGGDAAALAEYLLAVLDLDDDAPHALQRLTDLLATARRTGDVEIEVLALEALARCHAEHGSIGDARALLDAADRLMPAVRHLVTDVDRIDGARARFLLDDVRR
ncbi:BTAD domain-containing putative transcriptional regulator [Dactylosporangium sp. NPDC049525]|uniref:AfsR/SARP family transcriptional regulator n=1 Tax=Dactylosporangium sp. NPDC049525 TaxID=3154730 RepID=UPI003431A2F5